ncbi:hypothetical protein SLEP1_g38469 [Rubroshorea leprosula]|nr:hypothetical protein SLEP1_g38469 [Rubroshorea leprosula]
MEGQLPDIKKWVVFYHVYINSKKTVAEGRRISLSKACENPTCVEIGDCCKHLKLPSVLEVCLWIRFALFFDLAWQLWQFHMVRRFMLSCLIGPYKLLQQDQLKNQSTRKGLGKQIYIHEYA